MVLHCALEKGVQVPLLAADLPHTADIHAVDLAVSDTAQHTLIPIAQRAVPFIIDNRCCRRLPRSRRHQPACSRHRISRGSLRSLRECAHIPMHGAIFLDLALSLYLQLLVIKAQLLAF